MATEMLEKKLYDCKPATAKEFDDWIWGVYDGDDTGAALRTCLEADTPKNIDWKRLRHIRVIGDDDAKYLERFEKAGLPRGFYLNREGTWLLLILPEKPHLGDYFSRCGGQVESLWIFNSTMYSRDMGKLPGLKELGLRDNFQLDTIENLHKLTALQKLQVRDCPRLTALPGLEKLTGLTYLNLSGCENLTSLPGLEKLTGLTYLNLSRCENLTSLPGLEKLTGLTYLNLSWCRNLTSLPGLEKLTGLTELNLARCGNLRSLPGLEKLTGLTELNLSWCIKLTALPGLEKLTGLTELYLSACVNLTSLPEGIRGMKQLRRLNLSFMHLKELPDWLPEIAERFTTNWVDYSSGTAGAVVNLTETTVEGVDMSIFEQPYEMVVKWFKQREAGRTQPLNEIKVVFLGDGTAGKSHTIARLMNNGGEPVGYVDVRTPGIVIKDKIYPIKGRDATLHLWDFGGQDILHSMHRIFLTERTIYVVLVDGSIGNQDERARYWLQNIQSFAKNAPVLLVLNKLDNELQAEVNAADLFGKYIGLKRIIRLSALQYSQQRFNSAFTEVLLEEIDKTGYLDVEWPPEWIQVKHDLEQMDTNYIRGGKYLEICRQRHVDENQKDLLRWFHDLGISFCYSDNDNQALEDYVVLKPNWITNALYIILFNEREGGNGGLVPISTIRNMLGWDAPNRNAIKRVLPDEYYVGYDVNYVLDVFHAFKLSFRKDGQYEFFPMLADVNAKAAAKDFATDPDCLEFNMEFDYLPNNLLHRLMVERHQELDMDKVWRTGAGFRLPELELSALVVIDGNTLRFFIRHGNDMHRPNTYLAMLKANVDRIVAKMGLKAPECKLIYKLDGRRDVFDYEMLKAMLEASQSYVFSMTWRKMMPIADILNQSAPDGMEDEKKLLAAIRKSCLNIQGDMRYRGSEEDDRNTRIRDDLRYVGYIVHDQTRNGITESGKRAGELDLEIRRENNEPWTIVEGLRINSGAKASWNKHLDKLVGHYNPHGLRSLFLVAFADCTQDSFQRIWKDYRDDHIQGHDAGKFTYVDGSFQEIPEQSVQDLKLAKCEYHCGDNRYTVYHIFVQMEPKNNDATE